MVREATLEPSADSTSRSAPRGPRYTVIGLASFHALFFTPIFFVGALVWLLCLVLDPIHRRRFPLLLLLLSPLVVVPVASFLYGSVTYATGTATIWGKGLPKLESRNLLRDLRCYRKSAGCCVDGNEFMYQGANNLAIRTLARLLGPVPGGYDGPYPTREEAARLLEERGATVGMEHPSEDRIRIHLEPAALEVKLRVVDEHHLWESRSARAVLVGERCLVAAFDVEYVEGPYVILVDVETGEVFARYSSRLR